MKPVVIPDYEKVLADLNSVEVRIEDDPIQAGGGRYISEKLREIRDKTEVINGHLLALRPYLAALKNDRTTFAQSIRLHKQLYISGLSPLDRKGKSQNALDAEAESQKDIADFSSKLVDTEKTIVTWEAIEKLLDDRAADLRRANSDIRLQAQVMSDLLRSAGVQGSVSNWATQKAAKLAQGDLSEILGAGEPHIQSHTPAGDVTSIDQL